MFALSGKINAADMLTVVALRLCFRAGERYLTESQVIVRRFTPLNSYTVSTLQRLAARGAVQVGDIEVGVVNTKCVRAIEKPSFDSPNWRHFVSGDAFRMDLFVREFGVADCVDQLRREVLSCEAIEYTEYYVKKLSLHLKNATPNNEKLELLLLEVPLEKVHALLWRAIKVVSSDKSEGGLVEFSDITDAAFEIFLRYTKQDAIIEDYKRPRHINNSTISSVIQIYWQRAIAMN